MSERHREILRMIAEGLTDREIAKALFLSVTGAKACVRDIYWRYRLRNRAHAAAWAVREGLA